MVQQVHDVMTAAPVAVGTLTGVGEVAQRMRDEDIGAVLVTERDELRGLVTDRDLAIRVLAEGLDPDRTTVREACSPQLVTVGPDDEVGRAVGLMREHALRRLPVVENGEAVGVVALGDLAVEHDTDSTLSEISTSSSNT
ncbi:CBS domain-containing protein [Streptomyces tubbatahanensis]|uniref:CBS domain-containing protein n=1 Tax=Streptomyces tubbatahanensis TaxID=2923272 RepID=A0ABY3Y0V2_9ACTN|nr:CBS domain-containing protein [Streptomyces tubbatahanensis]UNT00212.1 CBS domain-containing protein [Streptomyces tubbatahanensis]